MKGSETYLIDLMKCESVPAVFTGNEEIDDKKNSDLYLELLQKGKLEGFVPVLIDKETRHYSCPERYGLSRGKEDYLKYTNILINIVNDSCLSVWKGRIIYNYFLDCEDDEDEMAYDLSRLIPPDDQKYLQVYKNKPDSEGFLFGKNKKNMPYDFTYENHVFVKVPTDKPWEVLAWIPMGGFNWCPDELHQVALAKYLYERFGACPVYISFTSLEYYIPEPIFERKKVEEAVSLLVAADSDIYEDFEYAVELIRGTQNWFMWWD